MTDATTTGAAAPSAATTDATTTASTTPASTSSAPAAPPVAATPATVSAMPAAPVSAAGPDNFPIGIEEFCTRHSRVEGPELLGAFYAIESRKADGQVALASEFLARLTAFASRTIG